MPKISNISAHKILDSNGEWTIETTLTLDDGTRARASVPSGHSVGKHEAKLLPPEQAIETINTEIFSALQGVEVGDQRVIDDKLIRLDGTKDKSRLGANSILSVSIASFKASAQNLNVGFYQHLNNTYGFEKPTMETFPTPLINLINGGAHASNNLEFQSFMLSPATFMNYSKSLEIGIQVYHKLKEILIYKNLKIDVGEEGGFSPSGVDVEQTCHFIVEAILESAIKAGTEMFLAIDVAASTFYKAPSYQTRGVLGAITADQLRENYINLARNFPILYLEDPFAEDSWDDWVSLKNAIGGSVEIVGDDLTVTNPERLDQAIDKKCITGVIIKTNQIGTLSESIEVIKKAQANHLTVVISHRSGETAEDSFMSDLAVGVGANYIKAGAPARGERTVKYNRLLEIESLLYQSQPPTVPVMIKNPEEPILSQEPLPNPTSEGTRLSSQTPTPPAIFTPSIEPKVPLPE